MRRLIVLTIAFMFICMPLLAQETGTGAGADAGGGETGGCGKIQMGSMGEPEGEEAAAGAEGTDAAGEDDLYYDEGELPPEGAGGEALEAECGAPDAEGFFVCTEGGVSYSCYCCDAADQQIPYAETCDPCCIPME